MYSLKKVKARRAMDSRRPITSFHMIDLKVFSGPNAEPVGVIVPGSKLIFTLSCYLGCHATLN